MRCVWGAGLRISEMMDLRVAQVDLVRSRIKLRDATSEAGVREVEMTLYLRDELLEFTMDRRARGLPLGASDFFFGTTTAKRRDPNRFRDRISRPRRRTSELKPGRARTAAASADHAALSTPHLGHVRRDGRPRSQVDRRADRPRQPGIHVLGLPADRHPSLHRRAGCLGADALCRRTSRTHSQPPGQPPSEATPRSIESEKGEFDQAIDDLTDVDSDD
jgi:hypothetical protein